MKVLNERAPTRLISPSQGCVADALRGLLTALAIITAAAAPVSAAEPEIRASRVRLEQLLAAYPDHLAAIEANELVWRDGTRMAIDDGGPEKAFEAWLERPDIKDMLRLAYAPGRDGLPPPRGFDPGRARNAAFFDKMYGDCRRGEVERNLVEVVWLPRKAGQRLKVTRINGVAERLAAVSRALDALPARFDAVLFPAAGTYNCRSIAGTDRASAHGYGIAVDLALAKAHYWRWTKPDANGVYPWRNAIPLEIVEIFEAHGFIWGGKWYHYDTMHFEYRPELLPPTAAAGGAAHDGSARR